MNIDRLKPVFIMACPRSGTTMIASQLGVHPDVIVLPELPFLSMILLAARNNSLAEDIYYKLIKHHKFDTLGIDVDRSLFIKNWNSDGWKGALSLIFECYFEKNNISFSNDRQLFWIEHYPGNVNNFYLLLQFFPSAKFIHIYRDPRAIYSSIKSLPRWPVGEPLRLANSWIQPVSKAFILRDSHPDIVAQVKYEDYVQDENELRRICRFIGVEFREAMLDGGGIILPEFTRGQHRLTMRRSDPEQAQAWRSKVSKRESDVISALCFEFMIYCGYVSSNEYFSRPTKFEKIKWLAVRMARHISSRIRVKFERHK